MEVDGIRDFYSLKRIAVEFLGTMTIAYFTTLTNFFVVLTMTDYYSVALCTGITTAVWAWLTRTRSGGHFNPAISIAFALIGQIPGKTAFYYMIAQYLGGVFAGGIIFIQLPVEYIHPFDDTGHGTPMPDPHFNSSIFIQEAVSAAFLAFVLVGLVVDKRAPAETYAISYGMMMTANMIGIGKITGGAINPAIMLGPALVLAKTKTGSFLASIGTIFGAIVGALIYDEMIKPKEEGDEAIEEENVDKKEEGRKSTLNSNASQRKRTSTLMEIREEFHGDEETLEDSQFAHVQDADL